MKVMVFSDVHANLIALEATLADAGSVDAYWFLGDLVGYGPDPAACVERVQSLPNLVRVLGNHDAAVLEKIPLTWFNREAQKLVLWTRQHLTEANLAFLAATPEIEVIDDVTLVHGSPRAHYTEYILTTEIAAASFHHLETDFCFVGHTHQPVRWQEEEGFANVYAAIPHEPFTLAPRAILNVGSVGQPRDGDPRASYALYDTETHAWEWRRVSYDIVSVQNRMTRLGLSPLNAMRLSVGH